MKAAETLWMPRGMASFGDVAALESGQTAKAPSYPPDVLDFGCQFIAVAEKLKISIRASLFLLISRSGS